MTAHIDIHTNGNVVSAAAKQREGVSWFEFKSGDTVVVIYFDHEKIDAMRMVSDLINDAFTPE